MIHGDDARRAITALIERYATPFELNVPTVHQREAALPGATRAWLDGVDAERERALEALLHLRARTSGSRVAGYVLLREAARLGMDDAMRWRRRFNEQDVPGARMVFLARTEVASRFAKALCELAERVLGDTPLAA